MFGGFVWRSGFGLVRIAFSLVYLRACVVLFACFPACLFFSFAMMVLIVLVSLIYVLLLRDGFDLFCSVCKF